MKRGTLLFLVVAALALFLRLWPIGHGLPRNYVPDTHVVRNALGMAKDKDLVPPVGKYSSYPYLLPYALLPIYAAEYTVGRATGAWHSAQEFGLRAGAQPAIVQLPARILVALLGAATAFAAWRAARALGLERGALYAAYFAATSLLAVQLSLHERPWAPMVFFGMLSIEPAVRYAREPRTRFLMLSGACAALAFSCHQAGAVFLGVPALYWLFARLAWRGDDLWRRLAQGTACVGGFLLLSVIVGHPYYLRFGFVPQDAVVGGEQAAEHISIGGQALRLGLSWTGIRHLVVAFIGYEPVLALLGVAGAVRLWRTPAARPVLVFTALAAVFFFTNPSDHVRYLLPVAALLALPAGAAAANLARGRAGAVVVALLLAVPLVQAVRMGWVLRGEDTRAEAEARLASLPAGAVVAIDHYGPVVDLSRGALERLATLRELRTRERQRLEFLEQGALPPEMLGIDAVYVEDLCEVDPVTGDYGVRPQLRARGATPAQLFAELGVTHLLLVDRGEHGELGSRLLAAGVGGPIQWRIEPGPDAPSEAFLPTEMRFPLTALWEVDRPGPALRLLSLDPVRR